MTQALTSRRCAQFKLKGRAINKFLIGSAVLTVQELIRQPSKRQQQQSHRLALHGCDAALDIVWAWKPILSYSGHE